MFNRMTRERFLSDAELEAFLAAVRERRHKNQPRDYALFVLLANTGIRPSEALALTWADVTLGADPRIRLHRQEHRRAPQPTNEIPVHPDVARVLAVYREKGEANGRLFPFTKRQSARLFHRYASIAGLRSCYRIYSLRHTAGMRLWEHTRDLRFVQAMMGHLHLKATVAYVHTTRNVLRAAMVAAQTTG